MDSKRIYELDAATLTDALNLLLDGSSLTEAQRTTLLELATYVIGKIEGNNSSVLSVSVVDGKIQLQPLTAKPSGVGLYFGTENPDEATRVNLNGILHATKVISHGVIQGDSVVAEGVTGEVYGVTGTAGETPELYTVVEVDDNGNYIRYIRADGVVVYIEGTGITVAVAGKCPVRLVDYQGCAAGDVLYHSTTTPGRVSTSGTVKVGIALESVTGGINQTVNTLLKLG